MTEGNGKPPAPTVAAEEGYLFPNRMPHDVLRKLNHREWLSQCALLFEKNWGPNSPQMTPFRAGMISRIRLAAEYISLLEADAHKLAEALRASERDLGKALAALKHHRENEEREDDDAGR